MPAISAGAPFAPSITGMRLLRSVISNTRAERLPASTTRPATPRPSMAIAPTTAALLLDPRRQHHQHGTRIYPAQIRHDIAGKELRHGEGT